MTHRHLESLYSVYQPIVDIRSRKILGYEALTRGVGRWRLPDHLFRNAYEQGFSIALDLECIWQSVRILPRLAAWKLLFVNIEPMTLEHAFVKGGEGEFILRKIGQKSRQVVFEFTEGMKGRDFWLAKKGVGLLRKFGCRFALDDVAGIGYKFFRLLSLKPEFLKIDISLIRGIVNSHLHQDLVRRLIHLGKKAGSTLIAEGLERREDVKLVTEMGIPYAQGFYFAKPSPHLRRG